MNKDKQNKLGSATQLVQSGRRKEWTQGIVNPPIWRASTVLFDSVADMHDAVAHANDRLYYGRRGTPTQWALAEALTALEPDAAGTMLCPSGAAAVASALLAILKPGDELLMVDSVYDPTRSFCDDTLTKLGITTIYYHPHDDITPLISKRTRAVFMESPGSLTFEVQDVPAIVAVAKAHGLVTLIDNTWATPLYFPAISHGVDLSIMSCTKYVGGHADLLLGSITAAPSVWSALRQTVQSLGQCISADEAWLALRGLRTMAVRLKQQGDSALKIAQWLATQPQVARVLHPALPGCPGHQFFVRDFAGPASLFSFVLNGSDEAGRTRLIDGLSHFGIGFSWGGYESLALPVDPERLRTARPWAAAGPVIRLHIGLEDVDDLIADLAAGLARL
jgi:cysteine-S-conjugate beta-lyase